MLTYMVELLYCRFTAKCQTNSWKLGNVH